MKANVCIALLVLSIISACSKQDDTDAPNSSFDHIENRLKTGRSALDFLRPNDYKSIIIEVAYAQGYQPTELAIREFVTFVSEITSKPEGIVVKKRAINSPQKAIYTIDEITTIEKNERQHYSSESQLALWIYFSDGESPQDDTNKETSVLGTAYWNTSFVIFESKIRRFNRGKSESTLANLEATVMKHEFGHLLGLTNLGTPLQSDHEDHEHEHHCSNQQCLMYWTIEPALSNQKTSSRLGPECIADLEALTK